MVEEENAQAWWKPTDEGAVKSEAHTDKLLKYETGETF